MSFSEAAVPDRERSTSAKGSAKVGRCFFFTKELMKFFLVTFATK
jgi:hypothetical protein